LLILSQSINKHDCYRQFLFLIGPFILLWGNLIQNLPYVLPTKFRFIWLLGFREDFLEIIRKTNCLWWSCLLTDRDKMNNVYRFSY
jgi:hypothetical protein